MEEKKIILSARLMSLLFTPFYLPLIGLTALFLFSNLSLMPFYFKATVLIAVYLFTVLMPTLFIHFYRHYHGRTFLELGAREQRMVPYVISIVCYFVCFYLMNLVHVPHFMSSIVLAALFIQIICAIINIWWKISTHTAAIGGVAGGLIAFAHFFSFNPVWWLSLVIVLSGMVGTSRMILRQHSLSQVLVGFATGFFLGLICIKYL